MDSCFIMTSVHLRDMRIRCNSLYMNSKLCQKNLNLPVTFEHLFEFVNLVRLSGNWVRTVLFV